MSVGHLASVVIPVYRDAERACAAAASMLKQVLPATTTLEILVVDDGSGDDTAKRLSRLDDPRIRLVPLPQNVGRSAARNAGALAAQGGCLVFMDCDCLPTNERFVATHLQALQESVASTGRVTGNGDGFWDRYQRDASMRREWQHSAGNSYSGSSQNLAVRTAEFNAIGGFDIWYRKYGFEDRDLLIRLGQRGSIAWTTSTVRHQDHLSLTQVATKMAEAGQYSSRRFASRHPEPYRQLGYAAIDAHLHPAYKPLGRLATPFAIGMANAFDRMRCDRWLPYVAARLVVKLTSALAYFGGTARSG